MVWMSGSDGGWGRKWHLHREGGGEVRVTHTVDGDGYQVLASSLTHTTGWYAAWCLFGLVYTYFLLPETKVSTIDRPDQTREKAC